MSDSNLFMHPRHCFRFFNSTSQGHPSNIKPLSGTVPGQNNLKFSPNLQSQKPVESVRELDQEGRNIILDQTSLSMGFPAGSDGKESACNAGDLGSIPGLGRSPGEGNGNPLQLLSLHGEFHGQRSLAGYSPWGHKESDTTERLTHTHTHTLSIWVYFTHNNHQDACSTSGSGSKCLLC